MVQSGLNIFSSLAVWKDTLWSKERGRNVIKDNCTASSYIITCGSKSLTDLRI